MSGLTTTMKNLVGMGRKKGPAAAKKRGKPIRRLTGDEITGIEQDMGVDSLRPKKRRGLGGALGGEEETL